MSISCISKRFFLWLSFGGLLLMITGCSAERKLAKSFIQNAHQNTVLVMPADFIYKHNLKAYEIPNAHKLDKQLLDSLLFERSLFLKTIDDKQFLEIFNTSLVSELRQRKIEVIDAAESETFMSRQHDKFIVNIAQLQLEEDVEQVYHDSSEFEYYFLNDIFLNKINFNCWIEISTVDQENPFNRVVFASESITDKFDGRIRFFPFVGEFKYVYTIDSITPDQIYALASMAGNRFAGYLFDFLMNDYIDRKMETRLINTRSTYFSWDPRRFRLVPAENRRFIIMQ